MWGKPKPLSPQQAQALYDALADEPEAVDRKLHGSMENEQFVLVRGGVQPLLRSLRIPMDTLVNTGILYLTAYDEELFADEFTEAEEADLLKHKPYLESLGKYAEYIEGIERDEVGELFRVKAAPPKRDIRLYDDLAMFEINRTALEQLLPTERGSGKGR